jgi:tetratricopeptide (TPR) repeat protein
MKTNEIDLRKLAVKCYGENDFEGALDAFLKLSYETDLEPKAQALYNCGTCCVKLRRHEEALTYFEQSLFIRREAKAFFNAAYACTILFKMDLARSYANKAYELDPNDEATKALCYRIKMALEPIQEEE